MDYTTRAHKLYHLHTCTSLPLPITAHLNGLAPDLSLDARLQYVNTF